MYLDYWAKYDAMLYGDDEGFCIVVTPPVVPPDTPDQYDQGWNDGFSRAMSGGRPDTEHL